MKEKKLVHGVGINDADYITRKFETIGYAERGKRIRKHVWICPYYSRWVSMLKRCYSKKYQQKFPSYVGCSVVAEWHYFMQFRAWMMQQDWEGKVLDKDILFAGNKVYSPSSCVFVDEGVNNFLVERTALRGEWPIGVYFNKAHQSYKASCFEVTSNKQRYLGYFETPEEAHQAWLTFKLEQAKIIASQQSDPRVAAALIDRYENYHTYFGETK